MSEPSTLGLLIQALPPLADFHGRDSAPYALLDRLARAEVAQRFSGPEGAPQSFGPLGTVGLPFYSMGAITSLDLFGLDELIIFSFYYVNRLRYHRAADIGANIGLHSIMMARCDFQVRAFEPDPVHCEKLRANLALNHATNVELVQAAVSDKPGQAEFVRVLGNTTGSHLAGSKANPYGELQRFPVRLEAIGAILAESDLVKMDVEGHERQILLATTREHWQRTDMIAEIGTETNAREVFAHFQKLDVNLFSQKQGWRRVTDLKGMPTSYKEGSLFISCKARMPWAPSA